MAQKLQNQITISQKKGDKKVPELLQVIKFKVDAIQALILTVKQNGGTAGITVHQLSQSVSQACMKAITYPTDSKRNLSKDIASALFFELDQGLEINKTMTHSILQFNINKDRLEMEVRLAVLGHLLDEANQTAERLKKLSELFGILASFFGQKFTFKFQKLVKEVTGAQIKDESKSGSWALTLPHSLWPISLAKHPAVHPDLVSHLSEFQAAYQAKFPKRKLQAILPDVGSVELLFNRKV